MRVICIAAHPDDCEIGFGGVAAKLARLGHPVKFLSVTNGDAGHFHYKRAAIADIRQREAQEAGRRLGIAGVEVLGVHDGELLPTLEVRKAIVRQIRQWEAEVVLTHRPWDYHPDHRYTGQLVQDSAYLVMVPHVCPETPALQRNPLFLYLEDAFQQPAPFQPAVAVDIEDVWDRKLDALDAHRSQVYEWLPWIDGGLDTIPADPAARRIWLSQRFTNPLSPCIRAVLTRRYGHVRASTIRHAEAFQICEYGRRPHDGELEEIFPL